MSGSLVYAYGSNLCLGRMRARVPSAEVVAAAELHGHRLCFHKRGRDGSGKADAHATGSLEDALWGLVFRVAEADLEVLDRIEGEGSHYDASVHTVREASGRSWSVRVYHARPERIERGLVPFDWYKTLVLEGARAGRLPGAYVDGIRAVRSRCDPDRERAREQLRALSAGGRR